MYRNIYLTLYFISWLFNLLNAAYLYPQKSKRGEGSFKFRIFDLNIKADKNYDYGQRVWSERKNATIEAILASSLEYATIITLQEALVTQVKDIEDGLNKNGGSSWTYFGAGADDGVEAGQFNPIFYDEKRWKLDRGIQKWMSFTPDVPSVYGGTEKRIFVVATLVHKESGHAVNVVNTQLDDKEVILRNFWCIDIVDYIREQDEIHRILPVIVSGDLNSGEENIPYRILSRYFFDSSKVAKEQIIPFSTVSGFSGYEGKTSDFVFMNPSASKLSTTRYEVMDNKDGKYRFSSHRPVVVDFST